MDPSKSEISVKEDTENIEQRSADELLLDEIWEIIFFDMLDDSRDLNNCYNTCLRFQRLLERKKVVWMFDQIAPHLTRYLNIRTFVSCRLVCRGWKTGVDNYFTAWMNEIRNMWRRLFGF